MTRWAAVVVGLGMIGGGAGFAQEPAVPPPPRPGGGGSAVEADVVQGARRMSEDMQALGDLIARDLGNSPRGGRLVEESRELALSLREFNDGLGRQANRFEARRAFSGIDASWHRLFGQLSEPGLSTPAIDQQLTRVVASDAVMHRSLNLNEYPAGYHGGNAPLSGMVELQRLTHALTDRAEALAAVIRADVAGPIGQRLNVEATNLVTATDNYHDALKLNGQIDQSTSNGFAGVAAIATTLEADLAQVPVTPRVKSAWQGYRAAEVLIRKALGLPTAPALLNNTVLSDMPGGGTPVTDLATQLVQQTAAFVQVFSQTAGAVPEGRQSLADAQALEAASADFRQDAARRLDPSQLAFEFRDIDAIWQRLARRTNRIARGRTGPNIQQIERIGQTVAEIHRLLALPGYAPVVTPLP